MPAANKSPNRNLTILTSTYPRWANDSVTRFVQDFAKSVSPYFKHLTIIAPHYKGARRKEREENITIKRFRYFWPLSKQNIVYDAHAVTKIKKTPAYALKLGVFVLSSLIVCIKSSIRKGTIINAHWLVPQGAIAVLAGKVTRKPVFITVHGGDVFTLNGKYMTKVKKWVLKRADEVIVNSSATKSACEQIYPDRMYQVIPMGINTDLFKPVSKIVGSGVLEVLFVGRLSSEKGSLYACDAIRMFYQKNSPNIHLTIIGDGPEKSVLEKFIAKHKLADAITLKGWLQHDEVARVYQSSDVFVGPSIQEKTGWQEALGLTFAEAGASQLPVIATDTGGIKDIVIDGKTGFLVEQKSAQAIYEKLVLLSKDSELRRRMGLAGRRHVEKNFTWASVAERYKKVFKV